MTDEPVYTFVKGEGWVVSKCPFFIFSHSGRTFILEQRTPNIGENYLRTQKTETPERFSKYIIKYQDMPGDYLTWKANEYESPDYITFVYRELT